jgi:hypothetical protein
MKKAICVGINNYPGIANDLRGCVNDANDWAGLLDFAGYQTEIILDADATRLTILSALDNLVTRAAPGDEIVFTYSGHGTSVADTNDDEIDAYDEALYVYDGILLDDELRETIRKMNPAAHLVVISDSCFSGSVTRIQAAALASPRYVETDKIPPDAKLNKRFLSEEEMIEILVSGCSDSEYSYDAQIDGRWNGAMTAFATSVLRKGQTYLEFYQMLRERLPSSQYPQTPQLEGKDVNKNRVVFAENTAPLPKPEPTTSIWDWIKKYWWVIALVVVAGIVLWKIF